MSNMTHTGLCFFFQEDNQEAEERHEEDTTMQPRSEAAIQAMGGGYIMHVHHAGRGRAPAE